MCTLSQRSSRWLFLFAVAGALPLAAQDTTTVRSNDEAVWESPRLVEELRIGVLEGDERYLFGQVSGAVPLLDGSVWVVDAQGPRLRIYDGEGRWVRDVSRPGEGPGEIASVMGIDRTPDGRVAVWDLPNARVSLYRQDGEYDGMFRAASGWWGGESFQVDRDGRYWVYTSIANPECVRTVRMPDGTTREVGSEGPGCQAPAYLRFTPDGQPLDTVLVSRPEATERVPSFVVMLPEGGVEPFVPKWSYALSPLGHLVSAHSMDYAVHVHELDGSSVTRIVREWEPVPLTRGERAEWEGRADFYDRTLRPGAASHGVEIPDAKPALRGVDVDRDGRIWINRYVTAEKRTDIEPRDDPERPPALTWREPPTYDVLDPSGRFLGTVVMPRDTRALWREEDVVWAVRRGELDENYVVRFRLVTGGG